MATWPVTVVAAAGIHSGVAARLAPGPAVPGRRLALPVTAAWLAYLEARVPGFWPPATPGRTWAGGWDQLTQRTWPGCSRRWPRSRSRPGWRWQGWYGPGESAVQDWL